MYGHPINLSFNKKGESHNTIIGGCCSIFVKLFIAYYVLRLLDKLYFKKDNKIVTSLAVQNFTDLGIVKYDETNFILAHALGNSTGFSSHISPNESL